MLGLDASMSRINRPTFRALRHDGYQVFFQDLWAGGYEHNIDIHKVAEANLADAAAEGFIVAGYTNASPWYTASTSMIETMRNAGDMWGNLDIVAVDVELDGLTEDGIAELALALVARQKRVCIYTAYWVWDRAGSPEWTRLAHWPLWNAFHDFDTDYDFVRLPYGSWQPDQVIGEQFQGTTWLHGVEVDINHFEDSFILGDNMGMTPAELARLETIEKLLRDSGLDAGQGNYRRLDAIEDAVRALVDRHRDGKHEVPEPISDNW